MQSRELVVTAFVVTSTSHFHSAPPRSLPRRRDLRKVPAFKCQPVGEAVAADPFAAADAFNRG